jgi:hypothetical protein
LEWIDNKNRDKVEMKNMLSQIVYHILELSSIISILIFCVKNAKQQHLNMLPGIGAIILKSRHFAYQTWLSSVYTNVRKIPALHQDNIHKYDIREKKIKHRLS